MEDEEFNQQLQSIIADLRRYAKGMLRRCDASLTIQATDLVNMAYLKLHSSGQGIDLTDPKSVFGLYVTTMKNQLRDYLRSRKRQKRGDLGWNRVLHCARSRPDQASRYAGTAQTRIPLRDKLQCQSGIDWRAPLRLSIGFARCGLQICVQCRLAAIGPCVGGNQV